MLKPFSKAKSMASERAPLIPAKECDAVAIEVAQRPTVPSGQNRTAGPTVLGVPLLGICAALLYLVLGTTLTLYNKWVMPGFHFPMGYFFVQQGTAFSVILAAKFSGLLSVSARFKWKVSLGPIV